MTPLPFRGGCEFRSTTNLHVEIARPTRGLTVLRCSGEIDLTNGSVIAGWVVRFAAPRTVVDLVEVRFLGASAACELLSAQATLRDRGDDLYLVVPEAGTVHRLLDLLGGFTILRRRFREG